MNYTKTKVTPYTAQIIHIELERLAKSEISASEVILRMGLVKLPSFCGLKGKHEDKAIIDSALNKVLSLGMFIKEQTPMEMLKYMSKDLQGIKPTDQILRYNGLPTMQEILTENGFASSSIITYVALTLTGKFKEIEKLNKEALSSEIEQNIGVKSSPVVDKLLSQLNSELKLIRDLTEKSSQIDTSKDFLQIQNSLKEIKTNLNREIKVEGLGELEKQMEEVKTLTENHNKQTDYLIQKVNETNRNALNEVNQFKQGLKEVTNKINEEVSIQDSIEEEFVKSREELGEILNNLNKSFHGIHGSLKNLDLGPIIDMMSVLESSQGDLSQVTKNHASSLATISGKVSTVTNAMQIVEEVLNHINHLMKSDVDTNLDKTQGLIDKILKDIEEIGLKHSKGVGN